MLASPEVSVIIPTLNEASNIEQQLQALQEQIGHPPLEVIVVDAGSTDGTLEILGRWQDRLAGLRIITTPRMGISHQRNLGVSEAQAEMIAICDGDDLVSPTWVAGMSEALERFELAGGPTFITDPRSLRRTLASPLDENWSASAVGPKKLHLGYLPGPLGCNIGFRKQTWTAVGGFDPMMDGAEDVDFVFSCTESGAHVGFNSRAIVAKASRRSASGAFAQHYRYGRASVRLYQKHRSHGMPKNNAGGLVEAAKLLASLPRLASSKRRHNWVRRAGSQLGRVIGSIQSRTLYL
jgi:glycosyltransferase involved in cell wall biosynthesis